MLTGHHLIAGQNMCARLHQVGNAAPVAGTLQHIVGYEGNRFGVIEFHIALQPAARHQCRHRQHQLVFLPRRQHHINISTHEATAVHRAAGIARYLLTEAGSDEA